MKKWPGFALAWLLVKFIGVLPRPLARGIAPATVRVLLAMLPRLRKIAMFNLRLAFPDWTDARRNETLQQMTRYIAWQAAEFARFPKYRRANIARVIEVEGHENFLEAQRRGKGVLILTGHIGAWELSSFAHAVYGYPLHFMARPLDNQRIDALVNNYRCASGNKAIFKNESARVMLKILKEAGTIGILADQNTMPEEAMFVDFFGMKAGTTTGIARVALHTGAAVVPGYAIWDERSQKYRL